MSRLYERSRAWQSMHEPIITLSFLHVDCWLLDYRHNHIADHRMLLREQSFCCSGTGRVAPQLIPAPYNICTAFVCVGIVCTILCV